MGYSTYGSFADLLSKAKSQAQLRGEDLSAKDIKSMGSGYFSNALEQTNADRAYNLANASQSLAEQAQKAQESQFSQSYSQSADQFAKGLAQQKFEAEEQKKAADKAAMQGNLGTGAQMALGGAYLAGPSGMGLWGGGGAAAGQLTAAESLAAGSGGSLVGTASPAMLGAEGTAAGGAAGGALSGLLAYGPAAGAGAIGGELGARVAQPIGKALNIGGEKERSIAGGFAGGAASGAAIGSVLPGIGTAAGAVVGGLVGGASQIVQQVFCFVAGTPVTMDDGSIKPVEEISLFDKCKDGETVNGTGVSLSADIYDYEGIGVTGAHAVYEDGEWTRIRDSKKGRFLDLKEPVRIYIINNIYHTIIVNGITFADYGECDEGMNLTEKERLDYLNANRQVLTA